MSSSSTTARRRSRRRLAIWLGFAALGMTMGAVWATGFATFSGGANGTASASPVVTPGSPTSANPLDTHISANTTWNVDWTGDWGSTAATWLFQIDLTGQPSAARYNVATLLTNGAAMSGATNKWQTLQLKMELVQAAGATCASSDFTSPSSPLTRLFAFDNEDSAVYWNNSDGDVPAGGIAGGGTTPWCVGIEAAAPPYDGTGTFLRDSGTVPDVYPNFVTTVNRVS